MGSQSQHVNRGQDNNRNGYERFLGPSSSQDGINPNNGDQALNGNDGTVQSSNPPLLTFNAEDVDTDMDDVGVKRIKKGGCGYKILKQKECPWRIRRKKWGNVRK